jgi:hypothetical protein
MLAARFCIAPMIWDDLSVISVAYLSDGAACGAMRTELGCFSSYRPAVAHRGIDCATAGPTSGGRKHLIARNHQGTTAPGFEPRATPAEPYRDPPPRPGFRNRKRSDKFRVCSSFGQRRGGVVAGMHMRRFTRLTNAFSKKVENHACAVALHSRCYNFVRIHQTLKVTPAMAAKVDGSPLGNVRLGHRRLRHQ